MKSAKAQVYIRSRLESYASVWSQISIGISDKIIDDLLTDVYDECVFSSGDPVSQEVLRSAREVARIKS